MGGIVEVELFVSSYRFVPRDSTPKNNPSNGQKPER